jgi:hypothetical protein
METNKNDDVDNVIDIFKNSKILGGFVASKKDDKSIIVDSFFSNSFLGEDKEELYTTVITVIAAMNDTGNLMTKQLADLFGIPIDEIRKDIADMYYEISRSHKSE